MDSSTLEELSLKFPRPMRDFEVGGFLKRLAKEVDGKSAKVEPGKENGYRSGQIVCGINYADCKGREVYLEISLRELGRDYGGLQLERIYVNGANISESQLEQRSPHKRLVARTEKYFSEESRVYLFRIEEVSDRDIGGTD